MTGPGIVTPEAVVLEFETAGMASRMLAALIDGTIQFALLFALLFAAGAASELGLDLGIGIAAVYVVLFLLLFGYPCAFETLWRGRTPGKTALGLRIVTIEGGPIAFRHAAIRAILGLVDKYLFSALIGVLALLLTARNQRLGDLVAGTIVLRERTGGRAPSAVQFGPPPGLESYVDTLDAARLGHDDYGAVRSFLLRATSLAPAARYALAQQLAQSLTGRLHAPPASGLHPEVYLACVAAAYQRRNGARSSIARPGFTSVWAGPASPSTPSPPAPTSSVEHAAGGFSAPA